ncbi:gas vesicle protein [Virgibacillus natechei]|uniref:Gas vesicle protein n=1 Tax=Virgibacillus natechei TaxID=1216297 RepID=A0ABS4II61_9BACI|nr:YtxH domain-containing protein [Virgibacillus natechei]MBP1970621.1 gas vesicle protein [Virgibacillus natechei]UZD13989.1 YtxH domain-containing protein [Virgibacillus natechei]
MGKRKLFIGIITGAAIGGFAALLDRETRNYTKNKINSMKRSTGNIVNNPSEAVHNVRIALDKFNENFPSGATSVMNALEQVENTLDKTRK